MKNTVSAYSMMLTDNGPDAELLDAWLEERSDSIAGSETEDGTFSVQVDEACLSAACLPYDEKIVRGQVRILAKRFVSDPQRAPLVAVIDRKDDDRWLVVPFSPYAYPATPGEMTTFISNGGLHVLQVWNAHAVQARLLEKSYVFGELDENVRQNALDLYLHETEGRSLPTTFDALTGPAVVLSEDPRQAYLLESKVRFRPLETAEKAIERVQAEIYGMQPDRGQDSAQNKILHIDFSVVREKQPVDTVILPFFGEPGYQDRMAAGNEAEVTQTFRVCKDELSLEYSPEDKMARLTFYDSDDRPNPAYDGYGVLGTAFEFLGVFQDGMLCVPADLVKNWFQLVDPDGKAVALVKKS